MTDEGRDDLRVALILAVLILGLLSVSTLF